MTAGSRSRFWAAAGLIGLFAAACSPQGGAAGPSAGKAAGAPAASPVRWIPFTDPSEHAFTLEVPDGWQVQGGSRRMSAVEIRTGVTMRAPDGSMELFFGDVDVPIFATPNPMLAMGGFREGMTYSPGYGQNFIVAAYQPGEAFAARWGQDRIARVCPGAAAAGVRALPQATQALDMAYAQGGVRTSIAAGEARFDCNWSDGPGKGYVFAATEHVESAGGAGLWDVKALAGFAARAERADDAAALLSHVAASFRIDPSWAAQQSGLTANVSHIVADTNAAVSQSIASSYALKTEVQDRTARNFDQQAIRGTATFRDPVEGERELPNAAHQWRLPNGQTVGTETAEPPAPGATELERVP